MKLACARRVLLSLVLISGVTLAATPPERSWTASEAFVDATESSGLLVHLKGIMAHAAACGDVDGDGDLDLYVGNFCDRPPENYVGRGGPVPNILLANENGVFVDSGQSAVVMKARTSGAVFADLDNDGDLDLYVSNNSRGTLYVPCKLFENVNGSFRDVSEGNAACLQIGGRSIGVLDYDGDGLLDLLVCEDTWARDADPSPQHARLFRNKGGLDFEDVTARVGLPEDLPGLGVVTADLNEDGWPDIFVSHSNRLFLSVGNGNYREAASQRGVFSYEVRQGSPCGVAVGDVDRDGDLDLALCDHVDAGRVHLYLNEGVREGVPQFRDVSAETGFGYSFATKTAHIEMADFDNDGWPDLYVGATYRADDGTSAPFICRNLGLKDGMVRFDHPPADRVDFYSACAPSADFDRDGRLDVFMGSWFPQMPSKLFLNRGAAGNHWLRVRVVGTTINRMGIGAKVKLYRAGQMGRAAALLGYQEIGINQGFCSGQEAVAHFGLGDLSRCDLEVILPFDRGTIYRRDVEADQVLVVTQ